MSLTSQQIKLIKSAIPLLKEDSAALAEAFYTKMIAENPSLNDFFNSAHQVGLSQPKALTHSLLMYAENIEDLSKLNALVARIVDKHVSLQIPAEGYAIVGKYLLGTIADTVGPEVANAEFLEAWTIAYNMLADLLISLEKKVYDENAERGWKSYQPLKIVKKTLESSNVVSLYLQAQENSFILPKPGQYLGFRLKIDGKVQCRQYSISGFNPKSSLYRISVKRIENGVVSNYIHDSLNVGDKIETVAPQGTFGIQPGGKNISLLSAGIGITPFLSMSKHLLSALSVQKVQLIQCDQSSDTVPFVGEIDQLAGDHKENNKMEVARIYSKEHGRLNKDRLADLIKGSDQLYVVGPSSFMQDVKSHLTTLPHVEAYYDFFGPTQWE